jgi:predicted Ser/Thr protein kinase
MNRESQLLALVVKWEESRANGTPVDPDELCRECPELLEELQQSLQSMAGIDAVLAEPAAVHHDSRSEDSPTWNESPVIATDVQIEPFVVPGYEILGELGRGGMGMVYKARQLALNRLVALKMLLPRRALPAQARRRFMQEAMIMALLQHPNVVQIYEIIERNNDPLLVMEYVSGGDLAERLNGRVMMPQAAAKLVAVLARTVQAAHSLGVVHRDLKPTNILLTEDGTPKICDFGVAKWCDSPNEGTQTGQVLGTPSYMAPEQLRDAQLKPGPLVDVYALGAILYEVLTGTPPFHAENALDTFHLVVTQEPASPRQLERRTPRDLETICLKCLEKRPEQRYATAQALADDLERFIEQQPIHARPLGPAARLWRWGRRHPLVASTVGGVTLTVAIVLVLLASFNRRLSDELTRTSQERERVVAARETLHGALVREVAERLDGDLREMAAVPLTLAALLEHSADWEERELQATMRAILDRSPLVFGLCVAYEPYAWSDKQKDFALYLFRTPSGYTVKQIGTPDYQPPYRQWDWYQLGLNSTKGKWSEPYVGTGANGKAMVSFSAPLYRGDRFLGVVTADLAMEYFAELRSGLDRLGTGGDSCCFVVTGGDRVLAHPDEQFEYPAPSSDLSRLPLVASTRSLIQRWHTLERGTGSGVDFATGRTARCYFERVPTTNWTVVLETFQSSELDVTP